MSLQLPDPGHRPCGCSWPGRAPTHIVVIIIIITKLIMNNI